MTHILSQKRTEFSTKTQKLSDAGIKLIAWARTIRWIGWGFGESLIPLFIFSFSKTFAEAGLFRSTYEIVMLLTLPIIGMLADRIPARNIILFALLLYPLVGISYFLAGIFGMAIFLVIARALNGLLWGAEDVGVGTYYRRMIGNNGIGRSFGYIDSLSNFGWIIAALIGMVLVSFVPIYFLLLLVSPFAIGALFIAVKAPKDTVYVKEKISLVSSYKIAIKEWLGWNNELRLLGALVLLSSLIGALIWFFIPIDAYIEGAKPMFVILLTVVAAIPSLFGYLLGKMVDKAGEKPLLSFGLIFITVILILIALFPQYGVKLVASFFIGIILELFSIIQRSLVTTLGSADSYGERGGVFETIITLGDLVAPLLLGILLDILGFSYAAIIVAVISVILLISFHIISIKNIQLS